MSVAPVVDIDPIFMSDCVLQIDTDDYAAALTSILFTPATSTVVFKGLKPGKSKSRTTASTWQLQVTAAQDIENADSFTNYCHEHEGETKPCVFIPTDGSTKQIYAMVTIAPSPIGGGGDAFATGQLTMPVDGKPAIEPVGTDHSAAPAG